MKLSVLPPLMILCSDLILQTAPLPPAAISLANPNAHSAQIGNLITVSRASNKIYHPSTGSCVLRTSLSDPLKLGPCDRSDGWKYTPQKFLVVGGTYFCLQAAATGEPAKLGITCSESDSQWDLALNAETYISTKGEDGRSNLCLDVDSENTLVTNPCLCSPGGTADCSSDGQLFEFGSRN